MRKPVVALAVLFTLFAASCAYVPKIALDAAAAPAPADESARPTTSVRDMLATAVAAPIVYTSRLLATPTPHAQATPQGSGDGTAVPPTPAPLVAVVRGDLLNVRTGPGTGYEVVETVKRGERLQLAGRSEDGTWLAVQRGERQLWALTELLDLDTGGELPHVAPPPAPVAQSVVHESSAPAPTATPKPRGLDVQFINPHYECIDGTLEYTGSDGAEHTVWGYRYFQVDMYVQNNSATPVEAPWRPTRWVTTDGVNDSVNTLSWQWSQPNGAPYAQPAVQPGQTVGWTFVSFPMQQNQWLKAVEFEWQGRVYRQEFDLGPRGSAYNYVACTGVGKRNPDPALISRP